MIPPLVQSNAAAGLTASLVGQMSVAPSANRQALIYSMISRLFAAGIWQKLDFLYVHAAHHEQAARLNWITPGTLTLTNNNSTTFTADRGFTGDGVSMSLSNAAYTPSNWTQNSGSVGAVALTNGNASDGFAIVNSAATIRARVRARNTTASLIGISSNLTTPAITGAAVPNMVSGERADSANQSLYVNGVFDTSSAVASLAFGGLPGTVYVLTNGSTFSTQQIAMAWGGASLGAEGNAAMYSVVKAYLAALGVTI